MSTNERASKLYQKLNWTEQLLSDLKLQCDAFLRTHPYAFSSRLEPETNCRVYFLTTVKEVPAPISFLTGDIIQNLRGALDHLAYQLVLIGTSKESTKIYFPIGGKGDEAYKEKLKDYTKWLKKDVLEAFENLRPYKEGNAIFWQLNELNNINKHRVPITTGSALNSMNIGMNLQGVVDQLASEEPLWRNVRVPDFVVSPSDRKFPLKVGDKLFQSGPNEPECQQEFGFGIAFGEPNVVDGAPIVNTLQQMFDLVKSTIQDFTTFLD